MSGWTCITLEPRYESEYQLPEEDDIDELSKLISRAQNAREREMPEQVEEHLNDLAERASSLADQTGEVTPEELVWDYVRDEWGDNQQALIEWKDNPTFMYPVRGLASYGEEPNRDAKEVAQDILDDCQYVERVFILSANDTGDDGAGELYRRDEDGNAEFVDHWVGYGGANGRDVEGYFSEEHSIRGCANPY